MYKFIFASLMCHRDTQIFKFHWFATHINLDKGFDIPHLLINDGTLTDEDEVNLKSLPNVIVDMEPIPVYDIPNYKLTGKLECFKRGLEIADRVIITDPDVFIYRPWDSVICKILTSGAICLRDWGSSIGWNLEQYKALFGVVEDLISPCCNTGVYSIPKNLYYKIPPVLEKHIKKPFQCMEDQGVFFAAYYGELEYITEIQCIVNNLENVDYVWKQILQNTLGAHLQGMRVRPRGISSLLEYTINNFPEKIKLSQFTPLEKKISKGLMMFGSYCYNSVLEAYPSHYKGEYIVDGMYFHAGSTVEWKLPNQCSRFESQIVCMDTGKPENCKSVVINGQSFSIGSTIDIELHGKLRIETEFSEGGHLCFLRPRLKIEYKIPDNIEYATYGASGNYYDYSKFFHYLSLYGPIEINVGNHIFGDPIYGKQKSLLIKYKNGQSIEIPENSNFIFGK